MNNFEERFGSGGVPGDKVDEPQEKPEVEISPENSLRAKYGTELVDKYVHKELVNLSRDENGNIDENELGVLQQKMADDVAWSKVVYRAVKNRLTGLGAYLRKRISHEKVTKLATEMEELATIDTLTTLSNRRGLEDELRKRFAGIARFENAQTNNDRDIEKREGNFWILMIDIDKFKNVNDTYGHDMGDKILVDLASIMKGTFRGENDFLARWGGEEFIAIVDEGRLGKNGVLEAAERLRNNVATHKFAHEQPLTISIGAAPYDRSGDIKSTSVAADGGLYIAKGETAQIERSGATIQSEYQVPQGDATRNQIWYYDNETEEYARYGNE